MNSSILSSVKIRRRIVNNDGRHWVPFGLSYQCHDDEELPGSGSQTLRMVMSCHKCYYILHTSTPLVCHDPKFNRLHTFIRPHLVIFGSFVLATSLSLKMTQSLARSANIIT